MKKNLKIMIIALMVIPCMFFLAACGDKSEEKNHIFNSQYFDYTNNVNGENIRFLYLNNSGGYLTGGEYTHIVIIGGKVNRFSVQISSFSTNEQNITINFEDGYDSVTGTFNDDWTEVVFNNRFPLSDSVDWRFVARA